MTEPRLEEDEAALAGYAEVLVDAVDEVAEAWIRRSIVTRAPHLAGAPATDEAAARGAVALVTELRELLGSDIADQREGPLQVFRRGVVWATEVLAEAGVAPVARDAFAERNFPDDPYDLTPASFAAIDPSLHEPGLVWGAAKAHVHLRRRREGV